MILPFQVWKDITDELEALREKHQILTGLQQSCRDVKRQKKGEIAEPSLEGRLVGPGKQPEGGNRRGTY